MSNMLGGSAGQPVATQATRYNGMQVQSSQYGMGLPIVYGQQRIAGTLIWYGDFQSIEHKQSVGKGGGGVSTSYTYSSSFQLALCEGPIAGIPTIWKDSGTTTFSDVNGTYSLGAQNQAAWSHLSGADALQYPYTAWVGCLNLALGSSPNVPNFNFEIAGLLQYAPTASPPIIDAVGSDIFSDLLTSTTHGLSAFASFLGDLTLYRQYCIANNLFLSLVVDQQTTMNEILTRLLQVTNSNTAWSNGKLIVIPYGDETVTGNGVTYTPPTTVQKYFTDSDYIKPVRVDQKPLTDLYNVVRVEYVNRANNYNTSVAEAKDQADIDNTFGIRQQEMIQGHAITNATLAQWVAQTILQRALYIRNTYTFTTTMENVAFEPGDVIALSDSLAGLVNEPVRIKSISEQGNNELQFVCEEFPAGVASGATQSVEAPAGYVPSVNGAPDTTQPPVIFRAPQFLTDGKPEVWIGVGGSGANWGGANILVSLDNVSYTKIGTVSPGCRYGTLTAALATSATDPDTTNSFGVALDAGGTISGGTDADADNLQTLMLIDTELVAYSSATLNSDGTYTLGSGYLRRGCYQTGIAAHAIGAPWLRVDDSFFRWQVDPSLVGETVYIKIQPWNLYGGGLVSESSLTPITYVVGTAEEIPDTPPTPTNFTATGALNGVHLSWTVPNPAAVAITSVEYSTDNATWNVLGQTLGTHYVHGLTAQATYYYRVRSRSGAFIWSAYTTSVSATGGTQGALATANSADLATQVTDAAPYYRTQMYSLPNPSGGGWFNLGTWNFSSEPASFSLTLNSGQGYNPGGNQHSTVQVFMRSANVGGGGSSAPNVSGLSFMSYGGTNPIAALKLVASGSNTNGLGDTWDLYVELTSFTGGTLSFTPDFVNSFTYNGAPASDPGGNSATVVVGTGGQYINPTLGYGLDGIINGSTYGRPLLARLNAGRPWIDFSENIHSNKNLGNIADGTARFAVANGAGLGGVSYWDTNNNPRIDFTQNYHVGKTLDNIAATSNNVAFNPNFVDSSRRVATISGGVSPLGSIVTGSVSSGFNYTGTSSSVTISWNAGTIYRMDGSTTAVSAGSVTVTGLSASTTYYAAAYFDEVAGTVNFVTGQSGAVGSPAILYAAEDAVVGWQAQLQSRLNLGWIPVATAASGGGGTGGNGSTGCCLHGEQLIELANGVMREAQELTTGDVLTSPAGKTQIVQLRIEPWREWYTVEFNDGRTLKVAPDHRFMDPSGVQIHARDLKLQDVVEGRGCYLSVARLELSTDAALKVNIEVQAPHTYYVDGVLSHNKMLC